MAKVYYGVNLGQHTQDVAIGTVTNGTNIEVAIDETVIADKGDALLQLEYLKDAIINNVYPFA
jgi:hypothetical protein